jgi:hypothetical protein
MLFPQAKGFVMEKGNQRSGLIMMEQKSYESKICWRYAVLLRAIVKYQEQKGCITGWNKARNATGLHACSINNFKSHFQKQTT